MDITYLVLSPGLYMGSVKKAIKANCYKKKKQDDDQSVSKLSRIRLEIKYGSK